MDTVFSNLVPVCGFLSFALKSIFPFAVFRFFGVFLGGKHSIACDLGVMSNFCLRCSNSTKKMFMMWFSFASLTYSAWISHGHAISLLTTECGAQSNGVAAVGEEQVQPVIRS